MAKVYLQQDSRAMINIGHKRHTVKASLEAELNHILKKADKQGMVAPRPFLRLRMLEAKLQKLDTKFDSEMRAVHRIVLGFVTFKCGSAYQQ